MPVSAYLRATILLIAAAAALFGSAGSLAIPTFWLYWAILVAVFVAAFALLDRGLLQERMRPGGRPTPLGLRVLNVVLLTHWIIAGLDRGRLHWSDSVPLWLQALGLVAIVAGYALVFWAMMVNRFFSSVVRIQSDRGQHVVAGGPYAFVRHDPGGQRCRARLMARRRISCGDQFPISFLSRDERGSRAADPIGRLRRLCAPCALEIGSRNLVIASGARCAALWSAHAPRFA